MAARDDELDLLLRDLIARGEHGQACDRAVRTYGPELIGWLLKTLPSEADAYDAFSATCERLWRSMRTFEGRCSVRVWCYMLARQCASAIRTKPAARHEELRSGVSSISPVADDLWSTTRRDAAVADDVYAEIRNSLDEEDRTLLVLRVDRDMPWRDIAVVLLGDVTDDDAIARKAAALRKQFERVKEQLRSLAAEKLGT